MLFEPESQIVNFICAFWKRVVGFGRFVPALGAVWLKRVHSGCM